MTYTTSPIQRIAIVRFSALGDVLLTLAAVQHLRRSLPAAEIIWITSPESMALLEGVAGIVFEVVPKPRSLHDYLAIYRRLRTQEFDVVLAMQANLRINLLYPALRAPLKIGFDRTRAREGQWLFTNQQIAPVEAADKDKQHLLDSFFAFTAALGVPPTDEISWDLPLSAEDHAWAASRLKEMFRPVLLIHPCASKPERDWPESKLAQLMQTLRSWDITVVLTGGNSARERERCTRLARVGGEQCLNLCGLSTLKQLAALVSRAQAVLAPDTFVVHLARALEVPVVGLYAVASSRLTGPYRRTEYCVDRHALAIKTLLGRDPETVPWNTRVHDARAMDLISVEDVLKPLRRLFGRD